MIGQVDESGRALVSIEIRASAEADPIEVEAWVDTAFNGELVMSSESIAEAGLPSSAGIEATLADGGTVVLETHACHVNWFGEQRRIEVVANEGAFPLLGVGLLIGRRLVVDYVEMSVTIE